MRTLRRGRAGIDPAERDLESPGGRSPDGSVELHAADPADRRSFANDGPLRRELRNARRPFGWLQRNQLPRERNRADLTGERLDVPTIVGHRLLERRA